MSRLIDADKLKHVVHCAYSDDLEILKKIDEQPTAFDVDKVVEQIESIKEKEYRACTDAQCGFCDYSNDCWDGEMCDKLALDKAIGLVKEGGVE
jgi:hypothetical protein